MSIISDEGKKYIVLALFLAAGLAWADSNYTVKKGDTLYSISRSYQITVAELCAANNFSDGDVLKAGQKLVIPSADIGNAAALSSVPVKNTATAAAGTATYVVQKGDTLYGIARKFNMNLAELVSMNNMGDNVLKVGQKLQVAGANAPSVVVKNDKSSASGSTAALASLGNAQIVWPLTNPTIENVKGKVSGVKLVTTNDSAVKAVRSGTVMYVGAYRGFGQVVFVESKTGLIYAYTWLSSISVKKGDYVVYGDTLGKATKENDTGNQTVTFMVFQNGNPIDPSRAPRG